MLNNLDKNSKLPVWYTKTRIDRSLFWVALLLMIGLFFWGIYVIYTVIPHPTNLYLIGFITIIFFIFRSVLIRFRVNDISPNSPDEVYKKFRGFGKGKGALLSIGSMPSYTETKGLPEGTKIFGITFKNKDPW